MNATMSIMGLYNWESNLFEKLQLPSGVDEQNIIDAILLECAGLECMFPTPFLMKEAIGIWSRSRINSWTKIFEALTVDYSPISTYNRREERSESINEDRTVKSNVTADLYVAAFNTDNLDPKQQNDNSGSSTLDNNITRDYESNVTGNSGVRMFQTLVNAELKLRNTDFTTIVVNEFKNKFCLLVY